MKPPYSGTVLAPLVLFMAVLGLTSLHAQDMPSQTLPWSTPNPVPIYQPVTFYAEVIGNGALAPTGTVTFNNAGIPIGSGSVSSVTNTNFALYSSQFNNPVWMLSDNNVVLTPNYTTSPLGDQTAYRYQDVGNQDGTSVYQNVTGLPGSQPATFSIWIESNTGVTQDVHIGIFDNENGGSTETPCYATSAWQRCSVTTPSNTNSVLAYIGSDTTPWQWDVSVWGAQVEPSTSAGIYVASSGSPATMTEGFATFATSDLGAGSTLWPLSTAGIVTT